jgi:pimeloyl-ACP methyl ester carboxylesterase
MQPKLLSQLFEIQCFGMERASPEVLHRAFFRHDLPLDTAAAYLQHVQDESLRATWDLYWPVAADLTRLQQTPALVMGAMADRVISPFHVQQTAAILGRAAVLLPEMGHAMMLEPGWERGAERILSFLNDTCDAA